MTALSPEEYINALDAELKLLELDRWETVALLSQTDPVTFMRSQHADFYLKHFGFHPEHRQDVKQALDDIRETGRGSISDVLAAFQASGSLD